MKIRLSCIGYDFKDKVRKVVDAERKIAFWIIAAVVSIDLRNEKKVPWNGASNVKIGATDWH
jgi:hypothetical protein